MKFHHIGIACDDIESAINFVKNTFHISKVSEIIFDENQNVNLCLLQTKCNIHIELVSGVTITNFINNGAVLISESKKAILFNYRRVAFLMTSIGVIELLESKDR